RSGRPEPGPAPCAVPPFGGARARMPKEKGRGRLTTYAACLKGSPSLSCIHAVRFHTLEKRSKRFKAGKKAGVRIRQKDSGILIVVRQRPREEIQNALFHGLAYLACRRGLLPAGPGTGPAAGQGH